VRKREMGIVQTEKNARLCKSLGEKEREKRSENVFFFFFF
jgi:hypothetical protein